MSALVRLTGPAAALLQSNINTDIIAPLVRGAQGSQQPAGIRSQEELAPLVLDLQAMTLTPPDGRSIAFVLPTFRREMLLSGTDEVAVTLTRLPQIDAYQARVRVERPWEWTSLEASERQ
jgi:3-isopropylmalate/(R)-2-methylmalate dehydratase small subunit